MANGKEKPQDWIALNLAAVSGRLEIVNEFLGHKADLLYAI